MTKLLLNYRNLFGVFILLSSRKRNTDSAYSHVTISVFYSINIYESYSHIYYHRALHDFMLLCLHLKFRTTAIFFIVFGYEIE